MIQALSELGQRAGLQHSGFVHGGTAEGGRELTT
eukprot:CAMPEP_0194516122 /NCGR_PEP_ID=MMETSP0253-20130528/48937_1 /TAXON_ID=2966 /ORGANISM="Noctiluca scintillans" /LENGTH=33 /DNA_ID= /DNA_START= /DNA_END= /DNA_ORIENTATION=